MGFLDSFQGNIQKIGTNVSTAKFDSQILETDNKIKELLISIGRTYLEAHREDCEQEYKEAICSIKKLEEERETLERNKLAAQGLRKCEYCHQIITLDSAFCNKCGSKLEQIVLSSAGGKFCPSCGASLEEGDVFCTSCGAKVN
ncbi:zinc ribbon domain-containing protein [Brotaphodocola sp.]|uniref:zinc ribbon domain-containing protein n=1 Tax=Brotaphodocola sp. TaxID=3073577 RepID=UPI003D7C7F48